MLPNGVFNWLNIDEFNQKLEIYKSPRMLRFFELIKAIRDYEWTNKIIYFICKLVFFIQIICLNVKGFDSTDDVLVTFLKTIRPYILITSEVTTESELATFLIVCIVISVSIGSILIYLISTKFVNKSKLWLPLRVTNVLGFILQEIVIGPIVKTNLYAFIPYTYSGLSYQSKISLVYMVIAGLNIAFMVSFTLAYSFYINHIGCIGDIKFTSRVNCNYEVYFNVFKISLFILSIFLESQTRIFSIIYHLFILLSLLLLCIYIHKVLYFYDYGLNFIHTLGWFNCTWFSFVFFLKEFINVNETIYVIFFGFVMISCIIYFSNELMVDHIISYLTVFDTEKTSLKQIEIFTNTITKLMTDNSKEKQILLSGIVSNFEEWSEQNEEIKENYLKLIDNEYLISEFNNKLALNALCIIYILYYYHLEKTKRTNSDILLIFCYFLTNKFKNLTFAVYLISKTVVKKHINMFYKFIFIENIKGYIVDKQTTMDTKLSSVVIFDYFFKSFQIKIFESCCKQHDYLTMMKNKNPTQETMQDIIRLSEEILAIREEIENIFSLLIDLNAFNTDIMFEYQTYINRVCLDSELSKKASKRYYQKRMEIDESNTIEILTRTNVMLVDGHCNLGQIVYLTPNFFKNFSFEKQEIIGSSVDDLVPSMIKSHHKEIIENGIKRSNLSNVFLKDRFLLFKTKTGQLENVKINISNLYNLDNGLIYMVSLIKMPEFANIILVDENFYVNGMTNLVHYFNEPLFFTKLEKEILNFNVVLMIPEILLKLKYMDKKGFYFDLDDQNYEFTANLYQPNKTKEHIGDVINAFNQIKETGCSLDANSLIYLKIIESTLSQSDLSYPIIYKLVTKNFIGGKCRFHKIYIIKGLSLVTNEIHSNKGGPSSTVNNVNHKIRMGIKKMDVVQNHIDISNSKLDEDQCLIKKSKKSEYATISSSCSVSVSMTIKKLKTKLFAKNEFFVIRLMKWISALFYIVSICLIILLHINTTSQFETLQEKYISSFLLNDTRITIGSLYFNSINLYLHQTYNLTLSNCLQTDCVEYYRERIIEASIQLNNKIDLIKMNSQTILSNSITMNYQPVYQNKINEKPTSILNILQLIVSYSLKLYAYPENDINIKNVENLTTKYISNSLISGESNQSLVTELSTSTNLMHIFIVIEVILCFSIFILFVMLSIKLMRIMRHYLNIFMNFKNPEYERYINKLEEAKKNGGQSEDANINALDISLEGNKNFNNGNNENTNTDNIEKKTIKTKLEKKKDKKKKINGLETSVIMNSRYFRNSLIKFAVKFFIFFFSALLFYVLILIYSSNKISSMSKFYNSVEEFNEVYIHTLKSFYDIKSQIKNFADNTTTKITIPDDLKIPTFGNLLMEITEGKTTTDPDSLQLYSLYSDNFCKVMFSNDTRGSSNCERHWSGALKNGIDKGLIQLNINIPSVKSLMDSVSKNLTSFQNVFSQPFSDDVLFVEYYLLQIHAVTVEIFSNMLNFKLASVLYGFNIIIICFTICITIFYLVLLFNFSSMNKNFYYLFNFVHIVPYQFILEDDKVYQEILKLGNIA